MTLGEKILKQRNKNGYSQEQLAEKITVSRQAVSKWELDQSTPDLECVIQLSNIFGVSIDYLAKNDIESETYEQHYATEEKSQNEGQPENENSKEKSRGTVFDKVPFPFVIPVFIISNLFGMHSGWNWFGKGEPNAPQRFPYPIIVGGIYTVLCLSGIINWHPGWVLFLTIPVYYLIATYVGVKKIKITEV